MKSIIKGAVATIGLVFGLVASDIAIPAFDVPDVSWGAVGVMVVTVIGLVVVDTITEVFGKENK